jgi:hypothetical protein
MDLVQSQRGPAKPLDGSLTRKVYDSAPQGDTVSGLARAQGPQRLALRIRDSRQSSAVHTLVEAIRT